ncbi:IMP dehydrogenase protein [Dioscorea alata]|uniref:IMP dehydrogenase protein n=1 Tax=Dioscorea alata TaxID=55571 RepID=A0ACB7WT53_DIOAL|nr:IMP dehydrogenase protein [Dioscorea alata]
MASASLHLHGSLLVSGPRRSSFSRISPPMISRWSSKSSKMTLRASTEDLRLEIDENPEGIISGEWEGNFSILTYSDLKAYLESQTIPDHKITPTAVLGEVMSSPIRTATVDQSLEEIEHHFEFVSGLPVVDGDVRCVGVVSRKDFSRASHGLKSKVGEVMSSPAITLSPDKTVLDAAALMLKMKVHRIPIVNKKGQTIGIVARSDIFPALEAQEA